MHATLAEPHTCGTLLKLQILFTYSYILLRRAFSTMAMQMEWTQTILLLGGSLFDHDKNCDGDDDHDDHQHYHYGEDSTKISLSL